MYISKNTKIHSNYHDNNDNNESKHKKIWYYQKKYLLLLLEWLFQPHDRVAFLPSVLRHGLRCVENCGIFVELQFWARAVGQTHFGSTA